MVAHQFAVGNIVIRRVIGDNRQVLNSFCYDGVDDLSGATNAQKSAKHDCHAVVNFLNGLLKCDLFIHNVMFRYMLVFLLRLQI